MRVDTESTPVIRYEGPEERKKPLVYEGRKFLDFCKNEFVQATNIPQSLFRRTYPDGTVIEAQTIHNVSGMPGVDVLRIKSPEQPSGKIGKKKRLTEIPRERIVTELHPVFECCTKDGSTFTGFCVMDMGWKAMYYIPAKTEGEGVDYLTRYQGEQKAEGVAYRGNTLITITELPSNCVHPENYWDNYTEEEETDVRTDWQGLLAFTYPDGYIAAGGHYFGSRYGYHKGSRTRTTFQGYPEAIAGGEKIIGSNVSTNYFDTYWKPGSFVPFDETGFWTDATMTSEIYHSQNGSQVDIYDHNYGGDGWCYEPEGSGHLALFTNWDISGTWHYCYYPYDWSNPWPLCEVDSPVDGYNEPDEYPPDYLGWQEFIEQFNENPYGVSVLLSDHTGYTGRFPEGYERDFYVKTDQGVFTIATVEQGFGMYDIGWSITQMIYRCGATPFYLYSWKYNEVIGNDNGYTGNYCINGGCILNGEHKMFSIPTAGYSDNWKTGIVPGTEGWETPLYTMGFLRGAQSSYVEKESEWVETEEDDYSSMEGQ